MDKKKACLVGIFRTQDGLAEAQEHLAELAALASTYGLEVVASLPFRQRALVPATLIGKGKIEAIQQLILSEQCALIVFDDEITPNQQKNLENLLKTPVIDRSELILGVFAQRAQTKEAQLQIALAQAEYQLPRLKRLWTHLSRQSGAGQVRGAGEQQIEIDKRLVRKRITQLRCEIDKVRGQRERQRQKRLKEEIPIFAIVGYTNVGKSTLMNALAHAGVLVEDKLFATLDTCTRRIILPNRAPALLIDTVGFIRKLPHDLIASFRSTLEEAAYTDVILHVIDVSSPAALHQAETTLSVLRDLGVTDRPIITVLNKIDKCTSKALLHQLQLRYGKSVVISAEKKLGLDRLLEKMENETRKMRLVVDLCIPQSEYGLVQKLQREGKVLFCEYTDDAIVMKVEISKTLQGAIQPFLSASTLGEKNNSF